MCALEVETVFGGGMADGRSRSWGNCGLAVLIMATLVMSCARSGFEPG